MRSILRRLFVLGCVLGLAVGLSQSVAKAANPTPNGPVQPGTAPFTGVVATPSGDIGEPGGLTYQFTGLTNNLGQFSDVEWGPAAVNAIQLALNGDQTFSTPGQTLTFSGISGNTATWNGNTPYPIAQPPSDNIVLTRLIMTANAPLIATSGYGDGATVPVTGDFSVNLLFEVSPDGGATWQPATQYFNSQQNVNYTPPAQGEYSSFLGGFFYVSNAPVAMVSPTSFDFGNQLVGQPSAPQTFMVTNTGISGLQFGTASVSGDFAIPSGSDTCSGTTVAPNGTCTISVTFTPTQAGSRTGTLTIPDNAADSPQQVSLSGTGAQPVLSLMPTSLTFGQAVNTTSSAQTVTITNTGTADLHVGTLSISGTNAGDFSATPSGCGDVAPNGTCSISVTFTPSASGSRTATLDVPSDAPTSPDQVSLSGTGLNSHLSLSPNPMNFGNVLLGLSKTLTLTFSNSGTDPTHITGVTIGGADPGDFTPIQSSLTCQGPPSTPPVVPAGGSCTVNVTFTPAAVGARSATFTIPNDSSDGPQQLTLSGNGTSPVAPQITSGASDTVPAGSAFSYTVTSTGTPTPALSLSSGSTLPAGVTFTDNGDGTGTLAGTSSVTPGVYTFTLQAANGVSPNATQAFTLTVAGSGAPVITSAPGTTVTAGTAMTPFTITTTGFPLPSFTKTGALPSGVTFTDNHNGTATISGNPRATTGGTYIDTITAKNAKGTVTQTFTLTVNQAPTITSKASTTFTAGGPGTFTVTTSGFPAPALTYSGALPAGVTFTDNGNGTATISGTPPAGGSYPILITATNTTGGVSQSFTLGVNQPLAITSAPGTTTTAGTAMTPFTITTTGYPVPSLTKTGTLPPGVTFTNNDNGTATIGGVPKATDGGNYTVTITAKNNQGTVTQAFTLVVDEAPIITSTTSTTFTAGNTGTFTFTTDGFPAAALTESGALPAGVTFTDNGNGTATISGIPTADGSYPIVITATNAFGGASESFTLKVD